VVNVDVRQPRSQYTIPPTRRSQARRCRRHPVLHHRRPAACTCRAPRAGRARTPLGLTSCAPEGRYQSRSLAWFSCSFELFHDVGRHAGVDVRGRGLDVDCYTSVSVEAENLFSSFIARPVMRIRRIIGGMQFSATSSLIKHYHVDRTLANLRACEA
jgi:hypothetical protein